MVPYDIALYVGLMLLSACQTFPDKSFYEHDLQLQKGGNELFIVEVNDQGEFHDRYQLDKALHFAEEVAPRVHVVVFVHGWLHNASPLDANLVEFKRFLVDLNAADANYRTVGIYLGWRGLERSYMRPWTLLPRKRVTEKIGRKAFTEMADQLRSLLEPYPQARVSIIGHSLGASVMLHALQQRAERGTLRLNRWFQYILMNPAITDAEYKNLRKAIGPRLIDPNTGAPILILQANKDFAVEKMLPVVTGSPSAGFVPENWTHALWSCPETYADCPSSMEAYLADQPGCQRVISSINWIMHARANSNCELAWLSPVYMITVDKSVSGFHNEILTSNHARSLLELAGIRPIHATGGPHPGLFDRQSSDEDLSLDPESSP